MFPLIDTIPARRTPWMTYGLITVNVLIFFYELSLGNAVRDLFMQWGVIPQQIWHAQSPADYLPLFTHMFLHGGWGHLLSNMWALWIFGDNVEDRMGHVRYLIFYLTTGVGAALVHSGLHPLAAVPSVGASGAISGVMGAYLLMFPYSRIITILPLLFYAYMMAIPAYFYIGIWFLGQLWSGILSLTLSGASQIAFWAHIGGFVAGLGLSRIFDQRRVRSYYHRYVMRRRDVYPHQTRTLKY